MARSIFAHPGTCKNQHQRNFATGNLTTAPLTLRARGNADSTGICDDGRNSPQLPACLALRRLPSGTTIRKYGESGRQQETDQPIGSHYRWTRCRRDRLPAKESSLPVPFYRDYVERKSADEHIYAPPKISTYKIASHPPVDGRTRDNHDHPSDDSACCLSTRSKVAETRLRQLTCFGLAAMFECYARREKRRRFELKNNNSPSAYSLLTTRACA